MTPQAIPCGKCGGNVKLFNQGKRVTKNEIRSVVECEDCGTHWGELTQRFLISKPSEERQELERKRKYTALAVVPDTPPLKVIDGDKCKGKTNYGKPCPNYHLQDSDYCGRHLLYRRKFENK